MAKRKTAKEIDQEEKTEQLEAELEAAEAEEERREIEEQEEKDEISASDIRKDKELSRQKITDILFNTPDSRMSELTFIPRRQVLALSMMETFESALDPKRRIPLRRIWRKSYYSHMRSVGQGQLNRATMLAETQMTSEETVEESEGMEL